MKISRFLTPNESRSALRPLILSGLSGLAFFLSATAGVQAKPILIGSQSFGSDNGSVTANTPDITTATLSFRGHCLNKRDGVPDRYLRWHAPPVVRGGYARHHQHRF